MTAGIPELEQRNTHTGAVAGKPTAQVHESITKSAPMWYEPPDR